MRYVLLFILILPLPALAQQSASSEPKVSVEAPTEAVIVGQPAIVRIKVLVPTFMPQPPVFPSLEQENLLVRLPERASGPISETVGGVTWSGVQRSYRLYPLSAGPVDFDVQEVVVTYADPDTNEAIEVSKPLPPITLRAEVPEGAEGLDPLIIATGFTLDQTIDGPTDMQAGDAITRSLTAGISGTTPLLIPALTALDPNPLLRTYPKEPRLNETEDRGVLSGQRVEETVYIAQDGGETQLPAVSVDWFNLETNQVETASVPAIQLTLAPPEWQPPDVETLIKAIAWIALLTLVLWGLVRSLRPRYRAWKDERQRRYLASQRYAVDTLKTALEARDLTAAYTALELWKTRSQTPIHAEALEHDLMQIGAARYSGTNKKRAEDWASAMRNLRTLNEARPAQRAHLPPLNP